MNSYLYFNDESDLQKNEKIDFSENGRTILEKRYLRRNKLGEIEETPEDMFQRVANAIAEPDEPYRNPEKTSIEFYNLISTKKFFPNSPTFTGAGTPIGQLAACFVLPVEDDLGKSRDGIFQTLRNAALIQQSGGGNGFSFSRLRAKGSRISTSNGLSTGPVGFMEAYNGAFGVIAQGGVRKGANMGILRVDHPDIREFITAKTTEGKLSNFNISVALTDKFLEAVEKDETYEIFDPHTKEIVETPKAREIFDLIVENAYKNGEPGVLFIDTANKDNPVPSLYELEATNPCGEQWLGPYENCCLGSINLSEHITSDNKIDWEELRKTVILSTRFLDNVVSANKYVPAVPQLKEAAHQNRRIGLGIMGLADLFYVLGVRYGSEEAQDLAGQVMEFIRFHAMKASIELAKERGPFPAIKDSIFNPSNLVWTPPTPLKSFSFGWERPAIDWSEITNGIRLYGLRNAAVTTVAPTGTISTVAGVEGYGCEPVFALAYLRNVYQAAGDLEKMTLTYVSPSFQKALDDIDMSDVKRREIIDEIIRVGSCQSIKDLPDDLRHTFVVSGDITPEEHIYMQASLQRFVDNSISKTCNLPPTAVPEDVEKVYMMGWKLGCKGLTVYVSGSRQEEVLVTQEKKESTTEGGKSDGEKPVEEGKIDANKDVSKEITNNEEKLIVEKPSDVKLEREYRLNGSTYCVKTPQGKAFITINKDSNGRPFEVFINVGKAGTDVSALSEGLGRLVSGWLRVPGASENAVTEIISQLGGIGGSRSVGFGKNKVSSIPDAVAKVLSEELGYSLLKNQSNGNGDNFISTKINTEYLNIRSDASEVSLNPVTGNIDVCPDCGNYSFIKEEGCAKCYLCGYSVC
ncbi:MAG TPA: adenosylcobalamin-dependent ribonucleoside-diphosphate reductase [Patescibacteria group bacterium]|nr:adenosylcobalamin-dependent ribonucleoside-diphosphate reductase [bacterium]HRY56583.1 adenosylcobalamin-dependent ribonucleoside-diphosphate reductase [Patescibacteria group bacterium]